LSIQKQGSFQPHISKEASERKARGMKLLCENLIDESTTDFIQRIVVVVVLDVAVVVNVVFIWLE